MFVEAEQYENAAKMLYILPNEVRFNPNVTDLLISIYSNLGQEEKAVQILDESIKYQKENGESNENLIKMLRLSGEYIRFYTTECRLYTEVKLIIVAKYKLDSGNPKAAAEMLEEIHKTRPSDVAVLAELIGAYSTYDEAKAAEASQKLPSLEELTEGINIDEVEQWAKTIGYKKPGKRVAEKSETDGQTIGDEVKKQKVKSKRKKKPRYPKNYKPGEDNGPIDLERWLPLRSRHS